MRWCGAKCGVNILNIFDNRPITEKKIFFLNSNINILLKSKNFASKCRRNRN